MDTEMEGKLFTHGPAEVYEPVQTLYFYEAGDRWWIQNEEGDFYHEVEEIYCNVPCATVVSKVDGASDVYRITATGRLTISGGVAYIDL